MSEKDNSHFIRLINMYHSAQINEKLFTGSHMEIEKGSCRITLPLQESYYHAMQAVHGSVYFKLLDDAAFFCGAIRSNGSFCSDRFIQYSFDPPGFFGYTSCRRECSISIQKPFCGRIAGV